jgi:hypothetical protein
MRLRISIPIMLIILLLIAFGVVTYFTWTEYTELQSYANQINEKRVMDNIIANIRQTANYKLLFQELTKRDDYISELQAYTPEAEPITEGETIPDGQIDLFNKTVRSIGANIPFKSEDGQYLFMRIDPDGYQNTGDELIVRARIEEKEQTILEKYLLLIIPGGAGIGAILISLVIVMILIGMGLAPIRTLHNRIPFAIHKGNIGHIEQSGDNEVRNLIHRFKITSNELNDINILLSRLAVTKSIENFLDVVLRYFEKRGMRSIVLFNKKSGVFHTVAYRGYWEDEKSIKEFNASEDSLLAGGSELFARILNKKDYAEINKFNRQEYLPIDLEFFGSPSIYAPIITGEFIELIIGGQGNLEPTAKRMLSVLTSRWGKVLYGIIQGELEHRQSVEVEEKSVTQPEDTSELPPIKDVEDEEDEVETIPEEETQETRKNVIEKMNEQTEMFNTNFKKGIILAKNKDYKKALNMLVPLTKIKKDVKLFDLVGKCYFNVKEYDKAIDYWQDALDMKPEDETIKQYIKKARAKLEE